MSFHRDDQPVLHCVPWRKPWDVVFSGWPLLLLVTVGVGAWLRGRWRSLPEAGPGAWRRGWAVARLALGVSAPALMVVAASVFLEHGENMRFKFFVEPLLVVLVVPQGFALAGWSGDDSTTPTRRPCDTRRTVTDP